ncbi:plasmid replication protein, CyRepA1 family [Mesorhizobium argentiipisi]|uniref:Replication origin-binding protein domain-containing protein n=1 Tax=Mesorhizobium argentiipisi TaxID=3015175 RepID=A0ABU8KMJ1_9HYPH
MTKKSLLTNIFSSIPDRRQTPDRFPMANEPDVPERPHAPTEQASDLVTPILEPSFEARRLKVAINPDLIDKNVRGNELLFALGWNDVELTVSEFVAQISAGVAYCSQLNGRRRKSENFHAADVVSVDVDHGMTVEQALELPLVRDHAAFVYTTPSHRPDAHRFRVVFILPRTVVDAEELRAVTRSLALRIGGDLSATDPCRLYFGNRGAIVHPIGKVISAEVVDELKRQNASRPAGAETGVSYRSQLAVSPHAIIRIEDGRTIPFSHLTRGTRVYCPFHNDTNPSAFVVSSGRAQLGIHCSTCNLTYWPSDAEEFDFTDFETMAKAAANGETASPFQNTLVTIGTTVTTPDRLANPMTYVKAPKGQGKTTGLVRLTGGWRDKVLLVGHRRLLSRQSASRLGLTTYLDCNRNWKGDDDWRLDRFAVSVDKIKMVPSNRKYKIVIIDESEQVLAHFLSDTISADAGRNREELFVHFGNLLRRAEHVIALDADLGWLTFFTLTQAKFGVDGRDPWAPVPAFDEFRDAPPENTLEQFFVGAVRPAADYQSRVIINETRPGEGKVLELYDSDRHLVGDLKNALNDKKKTVVVSNSKRTIEALEKAITEEFKGIRTLLVTSATSSKKEVKEFIENPVSEFDKYDVILASPTMGTGVDITFANNEEKVDVVFGLCHPNVNSHLDFDQQLSRVRHPRLVKVWISRQRYSYETSLDVIKEGILTGGQYGARLVGHETDGAPIYRRDLLLEMAALSVSQRRASMNKLRANFIRHKQDQGFRILHVVKDDGQAAIGKSVQETGIALLDAEFAEQVAAAPAVNRREFDRLIQAMKLGESISREEGWSLERTRLELFYRQAVTEELIASDDRGRTRERMRLYEKLMSESTLRPPVPHPPLGERDRFLPEPRRKPIALAELLSSTPIFGDDGFRLDVEVRKADLVDFAGLAIRQKAIFEMQLGVEIRTDVDKNPIQQLNHVLALVGQELAPSRTEKRDGQKIRYYSLNPELLSRAISLVERRDRIRAWDELYRIHGWGHFIDDLDD